MSYDRAITVFSPGGRLYQVEYAEGAVKRGAAAVGVKGKKVIVLAVEKKAIQKLQEARTVRKICKLDDHVTLAFAGLTADARVLVNRARIECQSHRLTVEDPVSIEYISRFVAKVQQRYTQRGGRRPFGISTIIAGFDADKTPHLYQTDPAGTYTAWKAQAIGNNSKTLREFLEKHYDEYSAAEEKSESKQPDEMVRLAIHSLLEVVESGAKNIEVVLIRPDEPLAYLPEKKVKEYVEKIEKEKDEAASKKKKKKSG